MQSVCSLCAMLASNLESRSVEDLLEVLLPTKIVDVSDGAVCLGGKGKIAGKKWTLSEEGQLSDVSSINVQIRIPSAGRTCDTVLTELFICRLTMGNNASSLAVSFVVTLRLIKLR